MIIKRKLLRGADPKGPFMVVDPRQFPESTRVPAKKQGWIRDRSVKEFYGLEEVAQILSMSKRLVEYKINSGELTSIKVGKLRRVSRCQLDAYVRNVELNHGFRRPTA